MSLFRTVNIPSRLRWTALPGDVLPLLKPAGTAIVAGERLTVRAVEEEADLLAPVDGTMGRADLDTASVEFLPTRAGESFTPTNKTANSPYALGVGDAAAWIERLRARGVQADRAASPDLLGQLAELGRGKKVDAIVLNLLDSDLRVPVNASAALENAQDVATAMTRLGELTGATKFLAAIDSDLSSATIQPIAAVLKKSGIRLIKLQNDYPQGDPSLLIFELLKRRLAPGLLPTEVGVLMLDGIAAVALGAMLTRDEPALWTEIGVRDHAREKTHLLRVPMGMVVDDLLHLLEIDRGTTSIRQGDLLREMILMREEGLGQGERVIHVFAQSRFVNPEPCVRCGWCVDACPTRIHPAGLLDAAQRDDVELADRMGIHSCIECGVCNHVCPSRLPILQSIRGMRERFLKE